MSIEFQLRGRALILLTFLGSLLAAACLIPAADASFPGLNGRIAFASNRDGDYDIYTMRPDGSDVTQLTFNRVQDREPSWSPDGNLIAYVKGGKLWTMRADRTSQRKLDTGGLEANHPSWSPDGHRIVFETDGGLVGRRLYVIGGSSDPLNVTPPERSPLYSRAVRMWSPAWNPKGQMIAVVIEYTYCDFLGLNAACTAVVALDEDGSNPRVLFSSSEKLGAISWSPDGTSFLVSVPHSGSGYPYPVPPTSHICKVWPSAYPPPYVTGRCYDGSGLEGEVYERSPASSPNGSSLVFQWAKPRNDYERHYGAPSDIGLIHFGGELQGRLFRSSRDDVEPDWQPRDAQTRPDSRSVMRLGRGIASWTIGSQRRIGPDFLRSERHRENDGPGCVGGPEIASLIDYYVGFRVSSVKGRRGFSVVDVATTRAGDRSSLGFVIGQSRLRTVRRKFPHAVVSSRHTQYALGKTSLSLFQRTGYESGRYLTYWFDSQGMLVALQTGESGC